MVAFGTLAIASIVGVVPKEEVFSGFGHPAVIIVALVLVISRGLIYSGAVELITQQLSKFVKGITSQVVVMGSASALLSSIINNIAALAILMPTDIQLSKKAKRNPSSTLMPLSFASILGGMVTLIGTAPNVVIATYRGEALGTPYNMFDFAYVGLIVAVSGVAFISLIGWRFIPQSTGDQTTKKTLGELQYIANAKLLEDSTILDQRLSELTDLSDYDNVCILGVMRDGILFEGSVANLLLKQDDLLVLEGSVQNIDQFIVKTKTQYSAAGEREKEVGLQSLVEVVVPVEAMIVGRSAINVGLLAIKNTSLLGISRSGKNIVDNVRKTQIMAGDVLLIHGNSNEIDNVIEWMECLPLARRGLEIPERKKAWQAIIMFVLAIIISSMGYVYLPVALSAVIVLYLAFGIIPTREVYKSISWPVIILLGSMIPIGNALNDTGGAATIASAIISWTDGYSPIVVLIILLVVTMTLSDILNNVATVLIAAPISLDIAHRLSVNPDAFLMAVAVGASCAFLTPIGHQNNSLILGPGGYKFGDYWRLGLPLEIIVIAVGVPAILVFWPL
ncbi:TrkA-C domain protein [hydrothermal vent metagenome]|jgi:di/tricarboxylate transporter